MNFIRLFIGIFILVFALFLQLWVPVAGIHGDFVLAALVAFAFIFPFWETVFFVLLAAFMMNWQPAPSVDILVFALLPIGAFALYRFLRWEAWIGVAVSAAAAVLAFYGIAAPDSFLLNAGALAADAVACVIFAEAVLWGIGN